MCFTAQAFFVKLTFSLLSLQTVAGRSTPLPTPLTLSSTRRRAEGRRTGGDLLSVSLLPSSDPPSGRGKEEEEGGGSGEEMNKEEEEERTRRVKKVRKSAEKHSTLIALNKKVSDCLISFLAPEL